MFESIFEDFYSLTIFIFAIIGFFVGEIIGLTYGIFALIPTGPFEEKNSSLGIVLIVLTSFGITGLGGAVSSAIVGSIIASPIRCIQCYRDQHFI